MEKNQRALDHIKVLVEKLNERIQHDLAIDDIAYVSFTYRVRLKIDNELQVILFERSIIDDLEVAFVKRDVRAEIA